MNKILGLVLLLVGTGSALATHPSVKALPEKTVPVKDYTMLDVNLQGSTRVFRFVDEVNGQKVLCYFTDGYYTASPQAGGGIQCMKLDH